MVVSMKITVFRVTRSFKMLLPYYQSTWRQKSEEHSFSLREFECIDFFFIVEIQCVSLWYIAS
jgi:hypothetical protein